MSFLSFLNIFNFFKKEVEPTNTAPAPVPTRARWITGYNLFFKENKGYTSLRNIAYAWENLSEHKKKGWHDKAKAINTASGAVDI